MSIRQRNAHFKDWAAVCKALSLSYSTDEVANEATARTALESSDNQFYYYVCYIKSAQVIYTHGEFYDCSYGKDEEAIAAALSSLATTKVGADNLKTINGESLVGSGDITTYRQYILDFFVVDLNNAIDNTSGLYFPLDSLKSAINKNLDMKILLMDDIISSGVDVLYYSGIDMEYITLSFEALGYKYEVNINGNSDYISSDMINRVPISNGGSDSSCNSCVKTSLTNSGSYSFNKNVVNILELNPTNSDEIFSLTFNESDPTSDINSGEIPTYKFNFYYNKYCTIGFTENISWANGLPSFKLGYIYEISFVPNSNVNGVSWVGIWSESKAYNLYELEPVSTGVDEEVTISITKNGVPSEIPCDLQIMYDNGLLAVIQEGSFEECQIACPYLEGDYAIKLISDTGEQGDFVSDSNGNGYLLTNNIISVE